MSYLYYFAIKPRLADHAPISVRYQDEKDELFLGPNVRLAGHIGMAHIETRELAEQFSEACAPRLQKRYGVATQLQVVECQALTERKLLARIQRDSETIRKRLQTGNFSPNKSI